MTTMTFTLSQALKSDLANTALYPSPYMYILKYSDGRFTGSVQTLASPGNVPSNPVQISVDDLHTSGRVYVLLQPNGTDATLGTTISQLSNGNVEVLTPNNAQTYGFQYQLIEATLTGATANVGDVSSLDSFAFPASISNVNGTRGFAPGYSGNQIKSDLNNYAPGTVNQTNGLAAGPGSGPNIISPLTNTWPAADWTKYVAALEGSVAVQGKMTIVSTFTTTTLSQYSVSYDSANDYLVLSPVTVHGANNTDHIRVKTKDLLTGIYGQTGRVEISPTGQPDTWVAQTNFIDNTADGGVVKYLVAGFDAGYWGGTGTSPNPADHSVIDLNKTWNWNYNYAYAATLNPAESKIGYTNALGSGPGTFGSNNRFYDPWAQEVQNHSNTYGWSFGDLISQGGTNPQLSMYDAGAGRQVDNINVKLFANSEITLDGFVAPPPAYVAPSGTRGDGLPGYKSANVIPTQFNANAITFSFGAGSDWVPNALTPATLKIYDPDDAGSGSGGFVSVAIPQLNGSGPDGTSIWNTLKLSGNAGHWTLVSNAGNNPYSGTEGTFTIYNVPVTSDGSTAWYQLVFGAAGHETTYNIYATSDSKGAFQANTGSTYNFVVDHGLGYGAGAGIVYNAAGGAYNLSFAPGGTILYDIATFSAPGTLFGANGNDSLIGTGGDDPINGGPGHDTINGGVGIDTAVSWEPSKNFVLKTTAGSATITLQDKVGTDGTDILTSVENIQFRDVTLDTSWITRTAALPAAQIMKVVDLYTAGLNRAPDAVGLDYWASRLADGASISDISKVIFGSVEAAPIYSSANVNPVFVNLAYQTALGRTPDAAGAAYWINELQTGHIQRTDFVTSLIAGARGPGGSAADAQYIANKEAVGAHFALTQGLNNATWARTVESGVNGTAASVTAANAQTDGFAATAATSAGSELVVQILGVVP